MTLDELSHAARATPVVLEEWAQLGAFGPRWKERRDRGKNRHITKEVAHRAIIMRALLDAGLQPRAAAAVAMTHETRDREQLLLVSSRGVNITIDRNSLNLP